MRLFTFVLPFVLLQSALCLNSTTETVHMRTRFLSEKEYQQEVAKDAALKVQSRIWAGKSQSPGWNMAYGSQGAWMAAGQPGSPQFFMPQAPGPQGAPTYMPQVPGPPPNYMPQVPGPQGPPPAPVTPPPPGGNVRPGPGGTWINTGGAGGPRRPGPPGRPFINIVPPKKLPGPKIEKFQYSGKACPPGSVSHYLSDDKSTFTMIFDKFTVTADPGPLKKDFIKHCIIRMDLKSEGGQQWAVWEQTYRGRVELDPGVRAARKSVYAFSGASATMSGVADFMGPDKRDFIVKEDLPMNRLVWAPCQRDQTMTLDIFTMVDNSRNPKGRGLLTVDSTDGKVTYKLGLKWQPCRFF